MLRQMPKDFFYDSLTKENFLRKGMTHLMETLEDKNFQQIHSVFDVLLKNHFGFEYREFVVYDSGEFGVNNVRVYDDDEMPQVVTEADLQYI
jgi:hypothetical protein